MVGQITATDFSGEILELAPLGTLMASLAVDGYSSDQLSFSIQSQQYWYAETGFHDDSFDTNAFKIDGNKLVVASDDDLNFFSWRVEAFEVSLQARDTSGNLVANTYLSFDPIDTLNDYRGTNRADRLVGTDGMEKIIAGAGDDKIYGKGGDDVLYGGLGKDVLVGGAGSDSFLYKSIKESTLKAPDLIAEWDHFSQYNIRDLIDLSPIDANTKVGGDQDFHWLGSKSFSGHAGELRYVKDKSDTYVYADVNGDKKADFAIHIGQAVKMYADDFLL